jgi:2-dehydropantoate 2-reductase
MADTIGIVGGGALGTLLASRFLAAKADVRVAVRSRSRLDALKREHPALRVGTDAELLRGSDLVLLCVKAYDVATVAGSLAALDLRETAIASLQNGWGHMEILAAALPRLPLLAGATSLGAYLDERGSLHSAEDGKTLVAPWRPGDLAHAERAAETLHRVGLKAESCSDARAVLWRKLVLNSAVNPLTALARCTNGTLAREPTLFAIAEQAAREAARVGWKLEVLERAFDPTAALRSVLRETDGNRSSMLEDLGRGRRTEVEEITGAVVRLAGEVGESTPVQAALLTLIRAAEGRTQN